MKLLPMKNRVYRLDTDLIHSAIRDAMSHEKFVGNKLRTALVLKGNPFSLCFWKFAGRFADDYRSFFPEDMVNKFLDAEVDYRANEAIVHQVKKHAVKHLGKFFRENLAEYVLDFVTKHENEFDKTPEMYKEFINNLKKFADIKIAAVEYSEEV